MAIRKDVLERIREASDILALVGGTVALKRSGARFVGLCPFHSEKTPSFYVTPERGWYKCFGCGVSGSVFDFVMAMDRVEFREAAEILAQRAGITLELDSGPGASQSGPSKSDLFRVNAWALEFCRRHLRSAEGAACREYLESRRISPDMQEKLGIGYSPSSWDAMAVAGKRQKVPQDLLAAAGLIKIREDGRPLDLFRNRLMFPIRDHLERVIAFGGRTLDGSHPKYLNSPETSIFAKRRCLYGVENLRGIKDQPVMVMEGYTDVIMAAQNGWPFAVATLGTSLTESHAEMLSRYTQRVVLVYDGDSAGRKAAERGASLFAAVDLDLQVSRLEGNEDPCEFLSRSGPPGIDVILERATDYFDFVLGEVCSRHDLAAISGKTMAADEVLKLVRATVNPVKRSLTMERVAAALQLDRADLEARLRALGPGVPVARAAAEPPPAQAAPPVAVVVSAARRIAEREVLETLMNEPEALPRGTSLRPDDFRIPEHLEAFEVLRGRLAGVSMEDVLLQQESAGLRVFLNNLVRDGGSPPPRAEKVEGNVTFLERERDRQAYRELKSGGQLELRLEDIMRLQRALKGAKPRTPRTEAPDLPDLETF